MLSVFHKHWKSISVFCLLSFQNMAAHPIIIAHRGASGYLPEHTLAAKAMAYAMNADYLEQDLVMTKDNEIVVLHDHYLDRVSNVAHVYPSRARADGRFYAIDFTLEELRRLQLTEGFDIKNNQKVAHFPKRFPLWKSHFQVHTFSEEIEFIQGLNHSTGRNIGIYPEIKSPWFHQKEGKDISRAVLETLKKYGYTQKDSLVYLQCFDPNELMRIQSELLPKLNMKLKLIQLIAKTDWHETFYKDEKGIYQPYNYDWLETTQGMQKVATYADGIGPWYPMIVSNASTPEKLTVSTLVEDAHTYKLAVHPYTFRKDALPSYARSFDELLNVFLKDIKVDGVFTDFPDLAFAYIHTSHELERK